MTRSPTRLGIRLVRIGLLGFIVSCSGAILVDPDGHAFWGDFWCELMTTDPSATWARVGLAFFVLAIAATWWLLPARFPDRKRLGTWVCALGTTSIAATIPAALTASSPEWHGFAILAAVVPGFGAVVGALTGLALARRLAETALGAAVLSLSAWNFAQFALQMWFEAPAWAYLPAIQKTATLLLVAWVALVTTPRAQTTAAL